MDFLQEAKKETSVTVSENGAKKYSTSNNVFIDDFCSLSKYLAPRPYEEVSKTMKLLWEVDSELCIKETLYIRAISRETKLIQTDSKFPMKGAGLKNEGIMRFIWLAVNHPDVFDYNILLFLSVGSWKDIFEMLNYDLRNNGWDNKKLNWEAMFKIICVGLVNPATENLVKKYLPTIKTKPAAGRSKANALIGKWLARSIFSECDKIQSFKKYRLLKSSGTAHKWQQLISKQLYSSIDWNTVAGRALMQLTGGEFLTKHGLLEDYMQWINSQPVAKFTGYVYELFKDGVPSKAKAVTIDKQFAGLSKPVKGNLLVCRDISGSMISLVRGANMSAFNIAKALALYFSEYLSGIFANHYVAFAHNVELVEWVGNTPTEKWANDNKNAIGNTNFQLVIDLLCTIKKNGVPEEQFPEGILCLSDGEYDNCGNHSNFQLAFMKLRDAGFSDSFIDNFKIILWDLQSHMSTKFEEFADCPNCFHLSGFDGNMVSFVLGGETKHSKPKTMEEVFENAMDQPILNRVIVPDNLPF